MKRAGGRSVQGYNAQVVASPEQVILAARVTQSHNDGDQLEPMVAEAAETLREAGIEEPIGTVLADGGYWNSPAISEVRRQGTDVLVPTQDRRRSAPRKLSPRQGAEAERIEAVLSTPEGQALYRRRQQIVEPVFAHTKGNPTQRPLPPPRTRGLPGGVATDRRHAQPAQTLAREPRQRGIGGNLGGLTPISRRPRPSLIKTQARQGLPQRPNRKPRSEALCNSLCAGVLSPLPDSNRGPPSYHPGTNAGSACTSGSRRPRKPRTSKESEEGT
jgi:hypothetical protein